MIFDLFKKKQKTEQTEGQKLTAFKKMVASRDKEILEMSITIKDFNEKVNDLSKLSRETKTENLYYREQVALKDAEIQRLLND